MSPFTPSGERARWRILYELLEPLEVGDVLTYEEMAEALDLDAVKDRQTMQLAMRRAAREFLTVDKRSLDVAPNRGYRVVEPAEHLTLARRHQRKARRAVTRSRDQLDNVDLNLIKDPAARNALELAAHVLARQADMMARMDLRQRNLEQALEQVTGRSDRTDAELLELRKRMQRLEEKLPGTGE